MLSWTPGSLPVSSGALLIAGACLYWAIDNNLTRKVSASDAMILAYIKGPFVGAALALVVQHEPLNAPLIAAAGLMAWAVWLHLSEVHEHVHLHTRLEHTHSQVHDAHHQHHHGPDWDGGEPHTHVHVHSPLRHAHPHYPDIHHWHEH